MRVMEAKVESERRREEEKVLRSAWWLNEKHANGRLEEERTRDTVAR